MGRSELPYITSVKGNFDLPPKNCTICEVSIDLKGRILRCRRASLPTSRSSPSCNKPKRVISPFRKLAVSTTSPNNIAENSFYRWRNRFGGMNTNEAARVRELEKENARLKRLLAERDLEVDIIKEILQKK